VACCGLIGRAKTYCGVEPLVAERVTGVLVLGCGVAGWLGDRPLAGVLAVRVVVRWRASGGGARRAECVGCFGHFLCWCGQCAGCFYSRLCGGCAGIGGDCERTMDSACALSLCLGARVLCCGRAGMRSEGAIGAEPSAGPGCVARGAGAGIEPGPVVHEGAVGGIPTGARVIGGEVCAGWRGVYRIEYKALSDLREDGVCGLNKAVRAGARFEAGVRARPKCGLGWTLAWRV
jgi:hypothetical protein